MDESGVTAGCDKTGEITACGGTCPGTCRGSDSQWGAGETSLQGQLERYGHPQHEIALRELQAALACWE